MKGTETESGNVEASGFCDRHRGVPLVKGTETNIVVDGEVGHGEPQRRPPREGD